jgi:Cu(I)/Ag(I) efflux system membrane fusion protein
MDLVTTESLGYVSAQQPEQAPLVIPATAPLITGKRAVVYVRLPDPNKPSFEGREVVLGPRAGDYYIVQQGLTQGDIVVTKGNFKIDSALQIQAKPSMMNPQGQNVQPEHTGHSGHSH